MMKRKLSEIISNIDEEYICEATDYVKIKSRSFLEWIKGKLWILGLAVLILIGARLISVLFDWDIFKKEPEKLVICCNYQTLDDVEGALRGWKHRGEDYSTIQTQIICIPKDEASAQIKIAEIRTEMMAGEGPDLFILATDQPHVIAEDRMKQMLFPNPEKSLYADVFLPLDSYLEDAKYINTQNCNQNILKVGQTKEGQLLLPLIYDYYACIFPESDSDQNYSFPTSWEEISSSSSMKKALRAQNLRSFMVALGTLADYENEELLVTEQDLQELLQEALSHEPQWNNAVIFENVSNYYFVRKELGGAGEKKTHTFYPVPNIDGGVTANISVYAGINRNTKLDKEAFSLLDSFYDSCKKQEYFFTTGIFIEQDEVLQRYYKANFVSDADIVSFLEMNDMITDARFYSIWDYALWDAQLALFRKDPEPIEQTAKKLYDTMNMQLKE